MSKFSSRNSLLVKKNRKKMRFLGFFKAQLLNRRLHKRSKKQQSGTLNSIEGSRKQQGKKKMKMTLFNDLVCNIPENKGLQIDDLSEDLLAGILQKTIARNPNSKYLYFENYPIGVLTIHFDDVQCQEYCKIKHLPGLPKVSGAWRAVSNGLICTAILIRSNGYVDNNIYLWNPLVEKYKTLPDSPLRFSESRWNALAFGFVSEINDYVVVHVVKPLHLARGKRDPHSVFISVYSLKSNSWKASSQDKVFICAISYRDAVFVNGAAFWIAKGSDYRRKILCYDTKSDMLRVISLPEDDTDSWPCIPVLHSLGQSSLAYFLWSKTCNSRIYDNFSMWVLKYDSLNEFSWEKKMSIDTRKGITPIRAEVLGVRNNGEPILARSKDLVSYNLDNDEPNDFVNSCSLKGSVSVDVVIFDSEGRGVVARNHEGVLMEARIGSAEGFVAPEIAAGREVLCWMKENTTQKNKRVQILQNAVDSDFPGDYFSGLGKPKSLKDLSPEEVNAMNSNAKAMNSLRNGIVAIELRKVSACTTAKKIWDTIKVSHEGTSKVREVKLSMLMSDYEGFRIIPQSEINRKILRAMPKKFAPKVTILQDSTLLSTMDTLTLFSELEEFENQLRRYDEEDEAPRKKTLALNVDADESPDDSDEEIALLTKKFHNFLAKRNASKRPLKS
ncbi:hypothetical protein AgCh_026527 [Apium graveolens]